MLSFSFGNMDIFSDFIAQLKGDLTQGDRAEIEEAIQDNFDEIWNTRGRTIGARWANNVDLVDTGRLRNSLTSGNNFRITKNQISIYTTVPYASFVDAKYPFMDVSAGTLRRIADVYEGLGLF